jgi:hypothetical protein
MGVVTKEKTVGFNYPPLKYNKFSGNSKNLAQASKQYTNKKSEWSNSPEKAGKPPVITSVQEKAGSDGSSVSNHN